VKDVTKLKKAIFYSQSYLR